MLWVQIPPGAPKGEIMTDQELMEKIYLLRKYIGLWNPYDKDFEFITNSYNELIEEARQRGLFEEDEDGSV